MLRAEVLLDVGERVWEGGGKGGRERERGYAVPRRERSRRIGSIRDNGEGYTLSCHLTVELNWRDRLLRGKLVVAIVKITCH